MSLRDWSIGINYELEGDSHGIYLPLHEKRGEGVELLRGFCGKKVYGTGFGAELIDFGVTREVIGERSADDLALREDSYGIGDILTNLREEDWIMCAAE